MQRAFFDCNATLPRSTRLSRLWKKPFPVFFQPYICWWILSGLLLIHLGRGTECRRVRRLRGSRAGRRKGCQRAWGKFKDTVLAFGGGEHPADVFKMFRVAWLPQRPYFDTEVSRCKERYRRTYTMCVYSKIRTHDHTTLICLRFLKYCKTKLHFSRAHIFTRTIS